MRYPAGHKDAKRKDLLQASAALIKERGFAATGIDAMADAAGVTSGAFYSHFGSKSALLQALIERELQHSTELWAGHCAQSLEHWLAYVLRHYLSLDHVQHPGAGCVLPALGAEIGRSDAAVKEVFATELQKGIDTLAQIDPETFEYRVRSAQADVDAARAAVLTAQANQIAAQTQVSRAQVDLTEAQRDFDRKQSLVQKQFIAQSEADKARALVNTSVEALKAVQAQVGVAQAQVKAAQANVAQRDAALAQARVDLARTRITSPVDGIVIKRAIERGQTVASSLQSPELFVIAKNLSDMQVDAAIDESDVGRLKTEYSGPT